MNAGTPVLLLVETVRAGDKVCFDRVSANYVVESVEQTRIGMIRHQHRSGSNSYWPGERVYVEKGKH